MASSWELMGTDQLIVTTKQAAAAQETISFKVNQGNAYSILGGYITVITQAGGSSCDVQINGVSILEAAQVTTAAGTFGLNLSDSASAVEGGADKLVSIVIAGGNAEVQVTLFVSQAKPQSIA